MKKLISLLFLSLIIGLGNVSAQTTMQKDSMTNNKNKMGRDTTMPGKNNMSRDSMTGRNNKMSRDSSMSAKNDMGRDSMTRSKNYMAHRDSMTLNKSMATDNGQNNDSMNSSNNKMKEGDMMASDSKMQHKKGMMMTADLTNWPEASKMAVEEITAKYGKPDGVTADELFWLKKGIWKKICISKMESKHSFPIEHTDMMQTTISYNVPEDKMDDLGKFDGSVTFDRTQGTMSARCDKEANNFLALNLANDIVLGKKTVVQARKAYGDIIKEKMKGGHPTYMEKLSFTVKSNTADPDKNTTGLTKEEVSKAIALNAKN